MQHRISFVITQLERGAVDRLRYQLKFGGKVLVEGRLGGSALLMQLAMAGGSQRNFAPVSHRVLVNLLDAAQQSNTPGLYSH